MMNHWISLPLLLGNSNEHQYNPMFRTKKVAQLRAAILKDPRYITEEQRCFSFIMNAHLGYRESWPETLAPPGMCKTL